MSVSDWSHDDGLLRPLTEADARRVFNEADPHAPREAPLAECPFCHKTVCPRADICHNCGNFLIREQAASVDSAWILLVPVLVLIGLTIAWLVAV